MNCEFCEKIFSNSQNCSRHTKTCKMNPSKQTIKTIIKYSETDLLIKTQQQKIEFLEQRIEFHLNLISQLIDTKNNLEFQLQEKNNNIKILISMLENKII